MKNTYTKRFRHRPAMTALSAVVAVLLSGHTTAAELDTGNPDIEIRFDNTVRYNAAWRVDRRNPGLANNPGNDEAEYLFDKGDMVSNRLDLFTEFDFRFQKRLGFRVSGALWGDERYGATGRSNPALAAIANYPNNNFTPYVKRYYRGPSGEFLDAFAWGSFELGDTTLDMKLGRHAVLWGEGMFPVASGNSAAYSQAPSDGQKQASSAGATAKETTLPINQLTATWQLNPQVSVAGLYTLEWRPTRISEGGTYFGINDGILHGPKLVSASPLIAREQTVEGRKGDAGMAIRWRPATGWLSTSNFAFYYRKFDEKGPTWAAQIAVENGRPVARSVYARDIKLWGASVSTNVMGTAVNAEFSQRKDTPLVMNGASLTSAALGYQGPRGDTSHFLVNTTTVFSKSSLFDSAALVGEFTYQRLDKITQNANFFKSSATTPNACTIDEIVKGCATKDASHLAMLFTPTWYQVLPGTDISAPTVYQVGLKGNAPAGGIVEGGKVFRIALVADYQQKHRFELAFTDYSGKTANFGQSSAAGPFLATNGAPAIYSDRANVSFTYQHNF